MLKRTRLPLAALLIIASLGFATAPATAQTRPNVIFIMTDDLGYGDIGVYGGTDIATPRLDRLAREGIRFTDFYANASNCSPTRTGFLTGRYQQRYGIERPLSARGNVDGLGLDADGRTLPQLLKNSGYATGLVGKWHLGYEDNQVPNAHGFDYFFGFQAGYTDYYRHTDGNGNPDLWQNRQQISEDGYMTDMITERAVAFIEANAGSPFFLSVQYNAPHWPYQLPDSPSVAVDNGTHLQPYDDNPGTREIYAAMVERADQGVGQIVDAVDAAGLSENTLIIYTNDNGGEWLSRNDPLFENKSSIYEGGIRVPAMLRWPGTIPAGRVTDQVGITMDLTRTILVAAGAELPSDLDLEGIDLLPIITGESPEVPRTLFWRTRGGQRAVRSGNWKYITQYPGVGERNFVFDLRLDVGEHNDLAWSAQGQAVARKLRPLLDAWEAEVSAEAAARAD
jgi:arylsulfatase A-like enzyme